MGSLLSTIIAIILFSILMVAGLVFLDSDSVEAEGKAPLYASQVGDLVEAAQKFKTIRGVWPADMQDLESEIETDFISLNNTTLALESGFACITLPLEAKNEKTLLLARDRFLAGNPSENLPANVSNKCGATSFNDRLVLAVALNGTDVAESGGYSLPNSSGGGSSTNPPPTSPYACGATPAASASVQIRGKFLSCYLNHVEEGYRRWIADGMGLMPKFETLLEKNYVMAPPSSWPDFPAFVGPYDRAEYSGTDINGPTDRTNFYVGAIYGTDPLYEDLTKATGNNSNGSWNFSGYFQWHNYSGRVLFRRGSPAPATAYTWDEAYPTAASPYETRVRYVAHWYLTAVPAAMKFFQAYPFANMPTNDQLVGFGAAPPPAFADYSFLGVTNNWARCQINQNPCITMVAPERFVRDVEYASYMQFTISSYYIWHSHSPKLR